MKLQELCGRWSVAVIVRHREVRRRRCEAHPQSTAVCVEVGAARRYPEIYADRRIVSMDVNRTCSLHRLERPRLGEGQATEKFWKIATQFVCGLQEQWASKPILEIRSNESFDMSEVMPDSAFQQVAPQTRECWWAEQIIEVGRT